MGNEKSLLGQIGSVLPIVGTAVDIGTSIWNAFAQGKQNRKNRQFALDMYNRQRADNLEDWQRNNAYNSPQAQMERLKAAGLNPNLVYGNGNAIEPASPNRASSVPSYEGKPEEIHFNPLMNMQMYADMRKKDVETDNVKALTGVAMQEMALKALQGAKTMADTARTRFDLELAQDTRVYSIEMMKSNMEKLRAEVQGQTLQNQVTFDANERAKIMSAMEVQKGKTETRLTEQNINKVKQEITSIIQERKLRAIQMANIEAGTAKTQEETQNVIAQRSAIRQQYDEMIQKVRGMRIGNDINEIERDLNRHGMSMRDPVMWRRALKENDYKEKTFGSRQKQLNR